MSAIALAVVLAIGFSLFWASPAAYEDILGGDVPVQLTLRSTGERVTPIRPITVIHREWVDYVTGRSEVQAQGDWFTDDERRHMADVRQVFIAAQFVALAALVALIAVSLRAYRRGRLARLLRSAAGGVAAAIVLVGVLAAVSFDAAFLLFHQVLFPQGNFLFAPGSNLLVVYPDAYWYGITIRIAVSILIVALGTAVAAHLALRAEGARSAIVTSR